MIVDGYLSRALTGFQQLKDILTYAESLKEAIPYVFDDKISFRDGVESCDASISAQHFSRTLDVVLEKFHEIEELFLKSNPEEIQHHQINFVLKGEFIFTLMKAQMVFDKFAKDHGEIHYGLVLFQEQLEIEKSISSCCWRACLNEVKSIQSDLANLTAATSEKIRNLILNFQRKSASLIDLKTVFRNILKELRGLKEGMKTTLKRLEELEQSLQFSGNARELLSESVKLDFKSEFDLISHEVSKIFDSLSYYENEIKEVRKQYFDVCDFSQNKDMKKKPFELRCKNYQEALVEGVEELETMLKEKSESTHIILYACALLRHYQRDFYTFAKQVKTVKFNPKECYEWILADLAISLAMEDPKIQAYLKNGIFLNPLTFDSEIWFLKDQTIISLEGLRKLGLTVHKYEDEFTKMRGPIRNNFDFERRIFIEESELLHFYNTLYRIERQIVGDNILPPLKISRNGGRT